MSIYSDAQYVSFVIPNYNSGNDLLRAVISILQLPLYSMEIVVVDDGSTDQSINVLKEYLRTKQLSLRYRVKILQENHAGAGNARNVGIQNCEGSYIMFVDSDDELLCSNVITEWLALNRFVDVAVFSDSIEEDEFACTNKEKLIRSDLGLDKNNIYDSGPCSKLFKTSFLRKNHLLFPTDIMIGEDLVFNLQVLLKANTIDLVSGGVYIIHNNTHSITHRIAVDVVDDDMRTLIKRVNGLLRGSQYSELISMMALKQYLMFAVKMAKSNLSIFECVSKLKVNRRFLLKNKLVKKFQITKLNVSLTVMQMIFLYLLWEIEYLNVVSIWGLRIFERSKRETKISRI